jgi:uncharacterized YccA/Bax inhibitor family protein
MNSGNPILKENRFVTQSGAISTAGTMTVEGTMNKIGILFAILALGAGWSWADLVWGDVSIVSGKMIFGLVGGLILGLVTAFKADWSPYTAPLYAFCEGMLLGGLSSIFNARYPGIALQAVLITFGIFAVMLAIYRFRIIQVTQRLRIGIVAATMGIALFYFMTWIFSLFGISIPFFSGGGIFGIVFSLIIVGIATFNLLLDFDFIEQAAAAGAPKFLEWYGAFGLMVTLVWLYVEILRLLARSKE